MVALDSTRIGLAGRNKSLAVGITGIPFLLVGVLFLSGCWLGKDAAGE